MRLILTALIVVLGITSAEARHRHHRHHGRGGFPALSVLGLGGEARAHHDHRGGGHRSGFIPPGWTMAPPDPNWKGKRFVSPDGQAWFTAFSAPAGQEGISAHMQNVAFAKGETITSLQGERSWIAVSGLKGDRIFYRKAMLACGGKTWHQIAFEFPVEEGRALNPFVRRAAAELEDNEDTGCDEPSPASPEAQAHGSGQPAGTTGAAH